MKKILKTLILASAILAAPALAQRSLDTIDEMIAKETDPEELAALKEMRAMTQKAEELIAEEAAQATREKKTQAIQHQARCDSYRKYGIIGTAEDELEDIAKCLYWGDFKTSSTTTSAMGKTSFYHYRYTTVMVINGRVHSYRK